MPLIIEGIITTQDPDHQMHVAPIGPHVDQSLKQWVLKPFQTSTTFRNLRLHNRAVFHVLDDGLLLVQAALGICNSEHNRPTAEFHAQIGWILKDACRAFPLQVIDWDTSQDRAIAICKHDPCIELKPFWGWNRACHSLLELAVVWSRRHIISPDELKNQVDRHRIIIEKTAGERELRALMLLDKALDAFLNKSD